MNVRNSSFSGNIAHRPLNPITAGGAIAVGKDLIAVEITNSAFLNNSTSNVGGAIANSSTIEVLNSTFYGNTSWAGGAVNNDTDGTLTMTNCTVFGNAGKDGPGGIRNEGTITFLNTIVAGSTGDNCSNEGTLTDGGYNLEDTDTCGFVEKSRHSLVNTNPLLSLPGNYGGPTWTLALLPNSPAIDSIPYGTNGCGTDVAYDQRGVRRPQGALSACDIGAFESRGFAARKINGDHQSAVINAAIPMPLRLGVSSRHGEPVEGGQVVFTAPESGAGTNPSVNTATISTSGSVIQNVVANDTPGRYYVTGNAGGLIAPVYFELTNKSP